MLLVVIMNVDIIFAKNQLRTQSQFNLVYYSQLILFHCRNKQSMIFFKLQASSKFFLVNKISHLHLFRCQNLFGTSKKLFSQKGHVKTEANTQQENLNQINTPLKNIQTINTSNPISQQQNKQQKPVHQEKSPLQNPTKSKKSSFLSTKKKSPEHQKTQQNSIKPLETPKISEEHTSQLVEKQLTNNEHRKPKWLSKQPANDQKKLSHSSSSYNLRSCEMILYQFKDIAKQSRSVKPLIGSFNEYMIKLRENNVEQTELKEKYKSVMYSAMMRMFARILRREAHPNRTPMVEFLGANYENVSKLKLDCLRTLEISDFVSFFFLFQLMSQFKNITSQKQKVVQRYLKELHERYSSKKDMKAEENEKELVDAQRMQKRYLSEVILASRCAQLFTSPSYASYLSLLLDHLTTKQLVPYKMVSILKFIMRADQKQQISSASYQKQLMLLFKIVQKIQQSKGSQLQQMDEVSLRQLYCNLVAIVNNNQHKGDLIRVINVLAIVQAYIISTIDNFTVQEVNIIFAYSLVSHSQHYKLAKFIYSSILENINVNGQTSLNPLFVVMMLTNVNQKIREIIGFANDELWQEKIVQLVNRYLISRQNQKPLDNLTYCSQYISRLIKNQPTSSKLYTTLINSIINHSLIIPYDYETLIIENHYLTLSSSDRLLMLATLYRLKNARSTNQKKSDFYYGIFNSLEAQITQQQKNDVFEKHREYIQSMGQIKRNKQGYVRMISKLCIVMKKQHLISDIFSESLSEIINFDSQAPQIFKSQAQISTKPKVLTIPQDYKVREKIYALLSNYVNVMQELRPNITSELLSKDSSQQLINSDKFIKSVKANPQINKILLEVISSKEQTQSSKNNSHNKNIKS